MFADRNKYVCACVSIYILMFNDKGVCICMQNVSNIVRHFLYGHIRVAQIKELGWFSLNRKIYIKLFL